MHRLIRDHLEQVLAAPECNRSARPHLEAADRHLEQCEECRGEIAALREQASLLRELRAAAEPRAGFYARVMERIEAQGPVSIWNVFSESAFGRRLAVASMALALLLGVYLVASEPLNHSTAVNRPIQLLIGEDQPDLQFSSAGLPDRDAVLVNLVTYREQ
jgi:predicted anti-sigma-YlaC factor YlaD